MPKLRVLFISRRFPPSLGGIEIYCYQLYQHLKEHCDISLVALSRSSLWHLLWFFPYAYLRCFLSVLFNQHDVIYFTDGVMAALAPLVRVLTKKKIVVTIHGLELTYKQRTLRNFMISGAKVCDSVVAVSKNIGREVRGCGIERERVHVIYCGIKPMTVIDNIGPDETAVLAKLLKKDLRDKPMLVVISRLVNRKGIAEFLENCFGMLQDNVLLAIAGQGPETARIKQIVISRNLEDRVSVLGTISETEAAVLRLRADLFLMPNIRIKDDLEGFGIAPLEAMYVGTPAIAFDVDSLSESVGEGGMLVQENDYEAFAGAIKTFLDLSPSEKEKENQKSYNYVRENFLWSNTAREYIRVFNS